MSKLKECIRVNRHFHFFFILVYVELSPTSSDSLTATLATLVSGTLTPAIAQRVWDIKVSQIECHATYR